MWFSTLRTQQSSRRVLLSGVLALASLQGVYARSQPQDIEEPGTVKQWEGLNLSLKTPWNGGPYILEILECAGLEEPEFYFTLLDLIKTRGINIADSDKEMYDTVVERVEQQQLLDHRFIPTWKFCISLRETAPRIEAQYQFYSNSVTFPKGKSCPVWFDDGERQSCNPEDISKVKPGSSSASKSIAFDRQNKEDTRKGLVTFYIDIIDKGFPQAYSEMTAAADKAGIAYKVRYKPSPSLKNPKPVGLSGYGVGLSLKKTDYLVIDDRGAKEGSASASDASSTESSAKPSATYKFRTPENLKPGEKRFPLWDLEDVDDPVRDLRDLLPLSQTNVGDIGFKTANFITKSGIFPPDMLMKILSDYPKYAHTIGTMGGVLNEWMEEHSENREKFVPPGYNIMFLNGMALDPSEVTATNLIKIMRRERHHGIQIRLLGLNQQETLDLLAHENITNAKMTPDEPRFDFREQEGEENAIIWLNDLAIDERYKNWPDSIKEILIPQYGGQLAAVRKNIHTVILPLDFSNREDLTLIAERLNFFVTRDLALTIGIVPVVRNNLGSANSRIFRALLESYDLETAVSYIKDGLEADKHGVRYPAPEYVHHAIKGRTRVEGAPEVSLSAVMESKEFQAYARAAGNWESRFSVTSRPYPFVVNGIVDFFSDEWVRTLSEALPKDVKRMQEAIEKGTLTDNDNIQDFLLDNPLHKRNVAIFPEDGKVQLINLANLFQSNPEIFENLPHFPGKLVEEEETSSADVWVIGDFDTESGYNLLAEASKLQASRPGISITAISNTGEKTNVQTVSALLHSLVGNLEVLRNNDLLQKIIEEIKPQKDYIDLKVNGQKVFGGDAKTEGWALPDKVAAEKFWSEAAAVVERKFGVKPGQRAIVVNGRLVGPFEEGVSWTKDDIETLVRVELKARITPILNAAKSLDVLPRLRAANYKARLTSTVSELLDGENTSLSSGRMTVRTNKPMGWKRGKTVLTAGDPIWSTFRFVVSLDPVSEVGQKWAPILRVLMSMDGVGIYTFLNPNDNLREVPIKRYYRHVLSSQPKFDENGDILDPKAQFIGLPDQTLYSLSMDVPPSWLVTPSETIHDLDNIKLQTFRERFGTSDLNATYVLKNILIEGHSRDTTLNEPSAGAQLELGTPENPVMQDTIIMSNLGYFQFKSNPGHWQIRLKPGRSSDIFSIQSLGISGFTTSSNAEDDVKDITLMSLNGVTLFPRLKRNKGYNKVDVHAPLGSTESTVEKATGFAEGLLAKLGLGKKKETGLAKAPAEINIFSVASGHLYERFLNIMMVSVMRHTKHTVKFWFIENFLSPAFKDFLPVMAKEYNFDYELVTYKWPHWLRAQKEKQREIWGYKILFLDVLFPLNLDKIIFVDADQIVRTDLKELVDLDLEGAVYGFTPMCDSRLEIEGYRFWKQGYWKQMLGNLKYHISALFVVDLKVFRQLAAGDRLRQQYHQLSADPNSLSNLDQDLPNNMQRQLPIFSLPQDWLWCETWCSDESFKTAKTIDLCNNPMTKEPKLDRARRQIPEWTEYDDEVAALAKKVQAKGVENMREALVQKEALGEQEKAVKEESSEEKKEEKVADTEKPKDEL
ncbi:uncharacterized protein DFL_000359 [Arthrobotrys flagrans]|uniref:UDP-glucose:glycoprotein glucosyltransferase n=1 Tax=Arthrobotrys flagrans TaxID=97331 RepID=A0A437ADX2_ARTFL|nr:hypothetical protein DFL_000359 [Arthrobotrys flagrans]